MKQSHANKPKKQSNDLTLREILRIHLEDKTQKTKQTHKTSNVIKQNKK